MNKGNGRSIDAIVNRYQGNGVIRYGLAILVLFAFAFPIGVSGYPIVGYALGLVAFMIALGVRKSFLLVFGLVTGSLSLAFTFFVIVLGALAIGYVITIAPAVGIVLGAFMIFIFARNIHRRRKFGSFYEKADNMERANHS